MRKCPKCGKRVGFSDWQCQNCQTILYEERTDAAHARRMGIGGYVVAALCAVGLLYACLFPAFQQPSSRGPSPCHKSLKQIGLALHAYHNKYGSLPPAFVADDDGRPMHSWRVLILPFLDCQPLYDRYDFSVPWNHSNNRYVLENMPELYSCYRDPDRGGSVTSYFAIVGPDCAFRGATPVRYREITDGLSNTLAIGEASGLHVPWTKPEDVDTTVFPRLGEPGGFSSVHEGGARFSLADGSVRYITYELDQETLEWLFKRNDGNVISDL